MTWECPFLSMSDAANMGFMAGTDGLDSVGTVTSSADTGTEVFTDLRGLVMALGSISGTATKGSTVDKDGADTFSTAARGAATEVFMDMRGLVMVLEDISGVGAAAEGFKVINTGMDVDVEDFMEVFMKKEFSPRIDVDMSLDFFRKSLLIFFLGLGFSSRAELSTFTVFL